MTRSVCFPHCISNHILWSLCIRCLQATLLLPPPSLQTDLIVPRPTSSLSSLSLHRHGARSHVARTAQFPKPLSNSPIPQQRSAQRQLPLPLPPATTTAAATFQTRNRLSAAWQCCRRSSRRYLIAMSPPKLKPVPHPRRGGFHVSRQAARTLAVPLHRVCTALLRNGPLG